MQGDFNCLNGGWASAEVLVGCLHRLLQPPAEPPDAGDLVLDRGGSSREDQPSFRAKRIS